MYKVDILHFCTYFDSKYLHRGLALYRSLEKTTGPFILWILCLDNNVYEILSKLYLPKAKLIRQQDLELGDGQLLKAKTNRSEIEYYWTCTPSLLLYIFQKYPEVSILTYLDSDMYFFSSPRPILEKMDIGSILIIPHDYSDDYKHSVDSGKYNVGLLILRADENGLLCLNWWRDKCIEWCYARHENGKYGDQAYLNDWPERFRGVAVSGYRGLNAGPWNIGKYTLSLDKYRVLIAGEPLICYHFHFMRFCNNHLVFLMTRNIKLPKICLSHIYRPYIKCLLEIQRDLTKRGFKALLPKCGIMWRYIIGCIFNFQPIKYFMIFK